MLHEGVLDEVQSSSVYGKPSCRIEVYAMPVKGKRKANKKQRRKSPARIDILPLRFTGS